MTLETKEFKILSSVQKVILLSKVSAGKLRKHVFLAVTTAWKQDMLE